MTYATNKKYFSSPNLENSYWAGFLAADGCLWKRGDAVEVSLQAKDKGHLQCFANCVGYDGKIKKRKSAGSFHTEQDAYRIIFYGVQQWHIDLRSNFNVTPQKTKSLTYPDLNRELELAYIIGYIDGDGCFSYCERDGLLIFVIEGNQNVLEWMKNIFDQEFPSEKLSSVRQKANGMFVYRFSGQRAISMRESLVKINVPKMKRKWNFKRGIQAPTETYSNV